MKLKAIRFLVFVIFFSFIACSQKKINGLNLVSPPSEIKESSFDSIYGLGANWVSIIPYAISKGYETTLTYNTSQHWWGERYEGVTALIQHAKKHQLKVMLKPHVWFVGGAATDFVLSSESDWITWEKNYNNYILFYAKVAQEQKVEILCFSTELKRVVQKRPLFFEKLIKQVKTVYSGKLTYAANWDNYQNVTFWNQLDYIGIDAYFPLSDEKQPTLQTLKTAWAPIKNHLEELSGQLDKPVLFTEYGFESCDFNTKQTWGSNGAYPENQQAQLIAYQSLFDTFYSQKWFAGGFLWKWHLTDRTQRNVKTSFTPQGKKAMSVVKDRFK
ncbi:glycoside hydrolase family 113 [Wenyingzhuangia sp. IMCC45533]